MTEDAALFLTAGFFASACLAAIVLVYWRRQKMLEFAVQRREQTLVRFSERFGTAAEFQEFAASPEAQALFATLDASAAVAKRLLAMVAVAIVLLSLGAGMLINSLSVAADADLNLLLDQRFARWWGTLSLAAGLGLLAAASVCARYARKWGVLGS
jgi:hypothetical protein